jgi:hypothetical protein
MNRRATDPVRRPVVEQWYRDSGWNQQLKTAIAIHDLVVKQNPRTQGELKSTTQDCINMLFQDAVDQ